MQYFVDDNRSFFYSQAEAYAFNPNNPTHKAYHIEKGRIKEIFLAKELGRIMQENYPD